MTQKLYTEEQVVSMLDRARMHKQDDTEMFTNEYLLSQATPIELPSDEEIYLESRRYEKYHESMNELEAERSAARYHGHMQGAKWMRDKILNK